VGWPLSARARARAALLGATVVWGTSFVVVQRALAEIPVFHLLVFRFLIATLLVLPFARPAGRTRPDRGLWRDGALVGVVLLAGFVLQTAGLLWTTPSRSAFLTALSVVLVPVIGLGLGRRPGLGPAAGAVVAALGLWLLYRPAGAEAALPWNRGDTLTAIGAVVFAVFVLLVEWAVRRHPVAPLALVQFAVIALLCLPSLVLDPPAARELTGDALAAVLFTGVLGTAAAFYCQLYAQRHLSAVEAGVILTLEPVVAAVFSVAVGAEPWTSNLIAGGALVCLAMVLSEIRTGAPPGELEGPHR
jgi:drug/metabolite transporter (DMT)-like permease